MFVITKQTHYRINNSNDLKHEIYEQKDSSKTEHDNFLKYLP